MKYRGGKERLEEWVVESQGVGVDEAPAFVRGLKDYNELKAMLKLTKFG